jgi:hypothetical protein
VIVFWDPPRLPTSEILKFLRPHHLVENTLEESLDCSPGPQPHVPQLFRAPQNASIGEERGSDDPAGLTTYKGLQIAVYTHRCQAGRTSGNRPGVETPDYPAPRIVGILTR